MLVCRAAENAVSDLLFVDLDGRLSQRALAHIHQEIADAGGLLNLAASQHALQKRAAFFDYAGAQTGDLRGALPGCRHASTACLVLVISGAAPCGGFTPLSFQSRNSWKPCAISSARIWQ